MNVETHFFFHIFQSNSHFKFWYGLLAYYKTTSFSFSVLKRLEAALWAKSKYTSQWKNKQKAPKNQYDTYSLCVHNALGVGRLCGCEIARQVQLELCNHFAVVYLWFGGKQRCVGGEDNTVSSKGENLY